MTRSWQSFIDALPREPAARRDEEHVARTSENLSRVAGSAKTVEKLGVGSRDSRGALESK